MNRVVITGIGIISCLGRGQSEILDALLSAKSGLELNQEYKDNGMRCHVSGKMKFSIDEIDRKMGRFMSETSAYSFVAAEEAIKDSGLDNDDIANNETGVIVGSGTGSSREIKRVFDASENGVKKIGPYSVTRTMGNTTSAVISTFFQTKGVSLSISSACSTSLHCVSHGFNLIKNGLAFQTKSDTEVLYKIFSQNEDKNSLKELNGMFSFIYFNMHALSENKIFFLYS